MQHMRKGILVNCSRKINGYKPVLLSRTLKSTGVCDLSVFLKTHEQYQISGPPTEFCMGSSKDRQSGQEENTSGEEPAWQCLK